MRREGWETVVVAATGPSFSEAQATIIEEAQRAQRCRVLAVNDAYRRLPHADVLYAADARWWDLHLPTLRRQGFAGELWSQCDRSMPGFVPRPHPRTGKVGPGKLEGVQFINSKEALGLSTAPGVVHGGRSSGHMAINLAFHFGGRRIVLVGFDNMNTGGLTHFFGDHPKTMQTETPFERMAKQLFPALASDLSMEGVDVVNATTQTALTCFKRGDLQAALWTH